MRIAFVCIPRYPCAVEVHRRFELAREPLIVGDEERLKHVLDYSDSTGEKQVRKGMSIRKALGLCPDAVVIPPDPVLYNARWRAIIEALDDLSPAIEDVELGRAYLDVSGLQLLYRDETDLSESIITAVKQASGLDASTGIANGKFPALAAAHAVAPGEHRVVPAGTEADFLSPFNVGLLPVKPEIIFRLQLLGLEMIGDLAALSIAELQSQFGLAGKRLWQLANGNDPEPLRPRKPRESLESAVNLEASVAGIEAIIAIARQLLSRLKPSLEGRAARELTLQAELASGRSWQHHLVFREPVSEDARLAFLLRSALTNSPPPQAVRSLSLRLGSLTQETGKQLSLGQRSRQQRQLEEAIRQLKTRYGYSPVYRCVDVEPWSIIPEDRQILVESDA
jgi:nucleotidyltransferase/DNA polymerase involved in DNA repair